ncbi:MAG: hypothetical protein UX99_C0003G0042 [Candidatus Amesbacteria bacterium GW2011_GWB1_47_26]|uniref:Uncharacterized protein n=1 Tax=Candidatus Amesbacteria bacterium GW2011_GWC2_45_19 TaxID=1618366 RepID=A0A0G1PCS0_9BACT|nr:MAG: hypothetical protein UX05_C0003G0042 [Candidatus Amesbacteria bacterium GW2011_GWC2_45_19]KKU38662.1 MAG: hypothetical protein UX52_C0002G0042 [Candidatus Amesbacteria bacterium GW2011_GWA1_46_35]KKU68633.1 MAG: hypothetical protein UX93_C0006G0050 [Microgenomates group bacterium GW2011_GWC1_47_20]KKU74982.1 MAG: hypothetical protein UX99_C0003G0042 [Candidatus Amesbacteria bacterium GW2011_GWB1_47_26]
MIYQLSNLPLLKLVDNIILIRTLGHCITNSFYKKAIEGGALHLLVLIHVLES